MNEVVYWMLRPTMNFYLRQAPEQTIQWRLNELNAEFSRMLKLEEEVREREKLPPVSDEELEIWTQNLVEKMEALLKELPEYKEEKIEREPTTFPSDELKDKSMLLEEFMKDIGIPVESPISTPPDLLFPEEKESRLGEFLEFDLEDVFKK